MSRKSKTNPIEKVKIVERVLAGEISVPDAARLAGVGKTSIRFWRDLYLSDGPTALMDQPKNKVYSQSILMENQASGTLLKNIICGVPVSYATG